MQPTSQPNNAKQPAPPAPMPGTPPPVGVQQAPPEIAAALDFGTHTIKCLIALVQVDKFGIISVGRAPSRGIRNGEIVDLEQASAAAALAVRDAQSSAGLVCRRYFVGAASKRSQGRNSRGSVTVTKENHQITDKNIEQAINLARNISLPPDRQIIDSVPQSFTVEDFAGVRNPLNMTGNKFDAEVYLATESASTIRNINACMRKIECRGEAILFEPFATADAVLTTDERELGAVLINIGDGTMDLTVYYGGAPRLVRVLPVGAGHIISDVAVGLSTTINGARELVHEHGFACDTLISTRDSKQMLKVATPDSDVPHESSLGKLCFIIECRVEEMFEIAKKEITKSLPSGRGGSSVILTGGAARLRGITKKAEQVFGTGARVGCARRFTDFQDVGNDPAWATTVGLLVYGLKARRLAQKNQPSPLFDTVVKAYNWVREMF